MTFRFTLSDIAKRFVDTIAKEMHRPIAKAATASRGPEDRAAPDRPDYETTGRSERTSR
jgi:hypothetical protein